MARGDRRKCKCCLKLFLPDPRNRRHQRYCSVPRCRAASKAASQARWLAAPENQDYFCGPVLVLSKLFRRLMLEKLAAAHAAGKLIFFGANRHLADEKAFAAFLAPMKRTRWFVYSKRPFAGPQAVLGYLSRYTHRVAISNSRLIAADANSVTFKVKDYRIEGPGRYTSMTLEVAEFIRRFRVGFDACMTTLSARADGRRTKRQWTKSREAARLRGGGLYEGLIETPALMVRDGTSRDEVDGAFKRVMALPIETQQATHTTRACWHGS